jgi:hypothetical protein
MTPCLITVNGRRALLLWLIAGSIALLQACATKPPAQYKVSFCNMEAASVSEVRANYGGTPWRLPTLPAKPKEGDDKCLGGYAVETMQALPDAMGLIWILDGRRHEAAMPIKSRLNGIYPTSGLQVVFQNGRVELFEYVYPTNNHLVRLRIYPPVAPRPKPEPKSPIRVTDLRESWTAQSEFAAIHTAGRALSPARPSIRITYR